MVHINIHSVCQTTEDFSGYRTEGKLLILDLLVVELRTGNDKSQLSSTFAFFLLLLRFDNLQITKFGAMSIKLKISISV